MTLSFLILPIQKSSHSIQMLSRSPSRRLAKEICLHTVKFTYLYTCLCALKHVENQSQLFIVKSSCYPLILGWYMQHIYGSHVRCDVCSTSDADICHRPLPASRFINYINALEFFPFFIDFHVFTHV